MEQKEIKAIIECLLFVSDKPLSLGAMQGLLEEVDRRTVLACLDELKAEYDLQGRAFHLVEIAEGYQLTTRVQYAPWIRKMFKTRTSNKLSRAALETLAIIAYRQPITKAEIEDIRGVSADGVVNALLDRRFIRIVGRKEVVGRPILYGSTKEFLHYFGLKDLTDMPMLKDLQDILESDEAGQAWEVNRQGELIAKVKLAGEDEPEGERTETAALDQETKSSREKAGEDAGSDGDQDADDLDDAEDDEEMTSEAEEESHSEDGNGHNSGHEHAEEIVAGEMHAGEPKAEEEKPADQQSEMEKDDPAGE